MSLFPASFDLSTLDGTNGFVLRGTDDNDRSGVSVGNAGDINNDGIDDVIIGASQADVNGQNEAGESYVVFGSSTPFSSSLNLSDLDGTNGFVLNGIDSIDRSGFSTSAAGDINNDGIDDLIIGANRSDPNNISDAGESYVVFGKNGSFTSSFDLSNLNGSNGFTIDGIASGSRSGSSVSNAGDINKDGIDDLIIGAYLADVNGSVRAGESYVVFGSSTFSSSRFALSALNGNNGFAIKGISTGDFSGLSVSDAGDVNGDSIDDVIIGAFSGDPNGISGAGESYVVYGNSNGFSASLDLSSLNGVNGFVLNGVDANDFSGLEVAAAGDINNDGISDLIVGAYSADPGGASSAGKSYIVFGDSAGFGSSFDLSSLNGTNGFVFNGIDENDYSGYAASGVGDINNDGIDDFIVGAYLSDIDGKISAGESYVVYGSSAGFSSSLDATSLNGANGFVINGIDADDSSGFGLGDAGDFNNDGISDFIVSSYFADQGSQIRAGESYIIFGRGSSGTATPGNDVINGTPDDDLIEALSGNDIVNGRDGNDLLLGDDGDDRLNGNAGNDSFYGGSGDDTLNGGEGNDFLIGQDGADMLNGGNGDDTVVGGAGADVARGDAGNDVLYGDAGNDDMEGGAGADALYGGDGDDSIRGGGG